MQKKTIILLSLFLVLGFCASAQPRFSVSTHPDFLYSFRKQQQFLSFGHCIQAQFHLTPVNGINVSFSYYSGGKFSNQLQADAKDISYSPQQIAYSNNAKLRFRHFSAGWKHYLKGNAETEKGWNMYGLACFGLLAGTIDNSHSVSIDTGKYIVPVLSGKGHFKRLTFDVGTGGEIHLGGDMYLYGEGKLAIPSWGYPSNYLLINDKAPLTATLGAGIRILF